MSRITTEYGLWSFEVNDAMAFERFDIYFSGSILPDHDPVTVRQTVAKLFNIDAAQLEQLFSGARLCIKRDVDADTAGTYRAKLRKAGILVEIGAVASQAAPVATQDPDQERPSLAGLEVSEEDPLFELMPPNTGTLLDCAPPPSPPPQVNIDAVTLAAPGSILDDSAPPPAADTDIGSLSAEPAHTGSLEDCVEQKDPYPIPDISHIKLSK